MNRKKVLALVTSSQATQVIEFFYSLFQDLPHFPEGFREFLVKIAPWFAVIGGIFGAIGGIQHILSAFGIREIVLSPGSDAYWLLVGIVELAGAYLIILAFPLLKERHYNGWILLFWNAISALLLSLIGVLFGLNNLVLAVLTAFIIFYLVFEMRPAYIEGMPQPTEPKSSASSELAPAKKSLSAVTKLASSSKKTKKRHSKATQTNNVVKQPAKTKTRKTK